MMGILHGTQRKRASYIDIDNQILEAKEEIDMSLVALLYGLVENILEANG